jgi:hypothetical protein
LAGGLPGLWRDDDVDGEEELSCDSNESGGAETVAPFAVKFLPRTAPTGLEGAEALACGATPTLPFGCHHLDDPPPAPSRIDEEPLGSVSGGG